MISFFFSFHDPILKIFKYDIHLNYICFYVFPFNLIKKFINQINFKIKLYFLYKIVDHSFWTSRHLFFFYYYLLYFIIFFLSLTTFLPPGSFIYFCRIVETFSTEGSGDQKAKRSGDLTRRIPF